MPDFGAGIELDPDLDLTVTPAGDIGTVGDFDELEKDLSFRLIWALSEQTLGVLDHETRSDIETTVVGALQSDPRVGRVRILSIEPAEGKWESVEVTAEVYTADGPFELVESV